MDSCVPRFATPRDHSWPSYGDEAADIAEALGLRLDPEQRLVIDVALEHHQDGRLRYRHVLVSTPRQQGKSTTALVLILDRLKHGAARGWGRPQRAVYGAQSARAASMKLLGEWAPLVQSSPGVAEEITDVRRSNGTEQISMATGGTLTLLPMTMSGGHGSVLDLAVLDEIFSHADDRAEVATRPAQLTRPSPQLVCMSTAGDTPEGSPFLWAKLQDARARAASGAWGNVCAFDWGAGDDDDPHDPATWYRAIPALASGRLPFEVFEAEHDSMSEGAWKRSYLNVWSKGAERLIPDAVWAAVQDPDAVAAGDLHAAVCVAPGGDDGRSASIVVLGRQDGRPVVELVEARDGTRWVVEACKRLDSKHRPRTWSVDSYGPSRFLIPELKRVLGESRFRESGTADTAAAAQRLHQAILDGEVRFRSEPVMDAAAQAAERRMVGDAWCFRLRVNTDVSSLIAASLAHHQLVRRAEAQLRRIV